LVISAMWAAAWHARVSLRISGDREHGFQGIVSSYFAGS
jgi:hypothetical protein